MRWDSPRARSATTCRRRSARPARAPAPKRSVSPTNAAGSWTDAELDLYHGGDDHRPAPVGLVHPAADRTPYHLLQLVWVGDAVDRGAVERLGDERYHRVEHRGIFGETLGGHGR